MEKKNIFPFGLAVCLLAGIAFIFMLITNTGNEYYYLFGFFYTCNVDLSVYSIFIGLLIIPFGLEEGEEQE